MKQWIKDTAGLGTALWLIGYLASLVLFYTPFAGSMGWILLAIFTPFTVVIAWVLIAVVLDYLFIVLMFQATYYGTDVFVYYTLTFLIPMGVGLYLNRTRNEPVPKAG